jgi:hypothetical protein
MRLSNGGNFQKIGRKINPGRFVLRGLSPKTKKTAGTKVFSVKRTPATNFDGLSKPHPTPTAKLVTEGIFYEKILKVPNGFFTRLLLWQRVSYGKPNLQARLLAKFTGCRKLPIANWMVVRAAL